MNGLRFIRRRCNLSLAELADQLHISRQAVSAWENGKREISKSRRAELVEFFGVEERFLLDITETEKKELLQKAMFRHDINGKEAYSYHLPSAQQEQIKMVFFGDLEETLDEKLSVANQFKNMIFSKVQDSLEDSQNGCILEKTYQIYQLCTMLQEVLERFQRQESMNVNESPVIYRHETMDDKKSIEEMVKEAEEQYLDEDLKNVEMVTYWLK